MKGCFCSDELRRNNETGGGWDGKLEIV